jgi:hypothetical protein
MISKSRSGRLVSTFGLAFTALLAVAAIAAGSASALSLSPAPRAFSASGGAVTLETQSAIYNCQQSAGTGFFSSGTSASLNLSLSGCKMSGFSCTTSGQASGTISTTSLTATPVYLDAAKTKFGLKLTPAAGGSFAEFTCLGIPVKWTGSLIGQITSPGMNQSSSTFTLSFAGAGPGVQAYQQVEGAGPKYHLTQTFNGNAAEMAYLGQDTLAFPSEVKFIP